MDVASLEPLSFSLVPVPIEPPHAAVVTESAPTRRAYSAARLRRVAGGGGAFTSRNHEGIWTRQKGHVASLTRRCLAHAGQAAKCVFFILDLHPTAPTRRQSRTPRGRTARPGRR